MNSACAVDLMQVNIFKAKLLFVGLIKAAGRDKFVNYFCVALFVLRIFSKFLGGFYEVFNRRW